MRLREYQSQIINDARRLMMQGCRRMIIQAPTGSGKTVLTAYMIGQAVAKGMRAWFTVHRKELIDQTCRTFREVGIPFGVVSPDHPANYSAPVQICSIQSLARRLDDIPAPRLLVQDEAHHIAAGQWAKVHARCADAFKVGLTATPQRLDGKGLHTWYDEIIEGPPVAKLIEDGWLAPYQLFAPAQPDLAAVRSMAGDYKRGQLASVMDKPAITGCAIEHYLRLCPGKQAIAFGISVEHSKHTAELFCARGVKAVHLDGETPKRERDEMMARFRAGDVQVISNCDLFSEGLDIAGVEAAILLRPTQSLTLYLQQVGRALRPAEGKQAIILDHAGNCYRHGMPDDAREWTLADKAKRKASSSEQEVFVRVCPVCFYAQSPRLPACQACGHVHVVKQREVERRAGELEKVTKIDKLVRAREQAMCETFEELVALGRSRGYRHPRGWASHIISKRRPRSRRVS